MITVVLPSLRHCDSKLLIVGWAPCRVSIEKADYELHRQHLLCCSAGKYFCYNKERKMPGAVYDKQTRSRLWQILEEQTGVTFPA